MDTYPRKDWSTEIKPMGGDSRAASDTGLGGMERERQNNGQMTHNQQAMERERRSASQAMTAYERQERQAEYGYGPGGQGTANGDADALSVWDANSGSQGAQGEFSEEERLNNAPMVLNGEQMSDIWPNIENNLPNDVIEAPTTMEEVYRGSMKSLLLRNIGNYVVATFLIGTQTTVSWEGVLYDVGNDYLAIYQSGRDQYIVSDLYSLKYVEFYDTRRRELCDSLLTEQQPSGNSQRM
ncbi:MAG: hypothetical protein IJK52_06380 [Oscillospiraceae bacterium]|nr:hypothetical protein [Oscillospiraceae bacterium]